MGSQVGSGLRLVSNDERDPEEVGKDGGVDGGDEERVTCGTPLADERVRSIW